jgi:alkaline phosphatase D
MLLLGDIAVDDRNNPEYRGDGIYFNTRIGLVEVIMLDTRSCRNIERRGEYGSYLGLEQQDWLKEIFALIEQEQIPGVILISGDRHGARAFKIPVAPGFHLYEFEVASLGGVPGPVAIAADSANQLFGYHGSDIVAFGEFTFDTTEDPARVTFRLIDESGTVMEEHTINGNH